MANRETAWHHLPQLAAIGEDWRVSEDQGGQWQPDVLGIGFEQRDLELPEGQIATLIRYNRSAGPADSATAAAPAAKAAPAKPAVLYLHGFVDYFFQAHVAEAFADRGYPFYAIDLRGYGRSIGKGSNDPAPNYVKDIAIYAEDLNAAKAAIAQDGHRELVLLGHSAGGLIGPMWAAANPEMVRAMILNSPWLDFNANWLMRGPVSGMVNLLGKVAPRFKVGGLKQYYGKALHAATGGEWDYNLQWKPNGGFPVAASWFSSVRRAQKHLKQGLAISCPVLVMTSLRRGDNLHAHPNLVTTDSVLDPRQMWRAAPKLGLQVEVHALEGGAHDLALSPEPVRSRYLSESLDWLDQVLQP